MLVFVLGLRWVHGGRADRTARPFAVLLILLLHLAGLPRDRGADRAPLRRQRSPHVRWRLLLQLLAFYSGTWLIAGLGLFFLVRAVGGDPPLSAVPFLGGVSAVGAIVAVLAVFAPSGLGPREATMYGLMLAIVTDSVALARPR